MMREKNILYYYKFLRLIYKMKLSQSCDFSPFTDKSENKKRRRMKDEYKSIQKTPRLCFSKKIFLYSSSINPINNTRNRYDNILAREKTRVKLVGIDNDYINANYITYTDKGLSKTFISTQAPLYKTYRDFWKMVWDNKSSVVVMLTDFKERGRTKADRYWENVSEANFFYNSIETTENVDIDLIVNLESTTILNPGILNIFTVTCYIDEELVESRTVYHIQYKDWGDHKQPSSVNDINTLISYMELYESAGNNKGLDGPPIVHCSAGVGRTGTFIACAIVKQLTLLRCDVEIQNIVKQLRTCRDHMVQNSDQYSFIYKYKESLSVDDLKTWD